MQVDREINLCLGSNKSDPPGTYGGGRREKRFPSGPEGLRGSGESAGRRRKSRSSEKACGWVEHEKSVVL